MMMFKIRKKIRKIMNKTVYRNRYKQWCSELDKLLVERGVM